MHCIIKREWLTSLYYLSVYRDGASGIRALQDDSVRHIKAAARRQRASRQGVNILQG